MLLTYKHHLKVKSYKCYAHDRILIYSIQPTTIFTFNVSLYYLKKLKFLKKLIINCSFRLNFSYATTTHCLFNELWQLPLKRSVKRRNKMIKLKTKLYIVYFCYFMFHVFICQKLQNLKNLTFFIKVIFF